MQTNMYVCVMRPRVHFAEETVRNILLYAIFTRERSRLHVYYEAIIVINFIGWKWYFMR